MADVAHSTTTITGGHANAVAAGAAGFMTGADKTKLDGITAAAAALTASAPADVTVAAAAVGVATDAARADHKHDLSTDFAAENLLSTGFIGIGATPRASAGTIRWPHGASVQGDTSVTGTNRPLLTWGVIGTNILGLGDGTTAVRINGLSGSTSILAAGGFVLTISSTGLSVDAGIITYAATIASPRLVQAIDATASVTCDNLTCEAQSGSGTTAVTGGAFIGLGGSATGASGTRNGGNSYLQPGTGATANGEAQLRNSAGTPQFRVNSTGVSLFNATPAAQPADMGALTDSTGGSVDGTLVDVGVAFSQANVNNNFADLASKVNSIRTALRSLGIMA